MRVVVGHQLDRYWSISGAVRVEGVGVNNVPFDAPPAFTSVEGEHFLVAPRVTVMRDSRDSVLRPTEGSTVQASFEEVLGDFTFPVINLEAHKYFTTFQRPDGSGKQVVAVRSQVAWEGENAPVYERFYGGGFQTVRGFAFRGMGPMEPGTLPTSGLFSVGGNFMLLNSLEYQIPIKANDHLYAVAFVDSGTVEQGLRITDYRVSVGFGLRITVPMMGPVPIALEFGFPIVKAPNDQQQLFSFYVGLFR
jgi:outer membrane protein insertion porin family